MDATIDLKIPNSESQQIADFWGVPLRTANKWRAANKPVGDPIAMARLFLSQKTAPSSAKNKARSLLREMMGIENGGGQNGHKKPELIADPDWAEFELTTKGNYEDEKYGQLARFRDFAIFKLEKSHKMGDESGVRGFGDQHIRYEQAIRQNKLADLRLGIDEGLLVPKAEFERLLRALVYWLMRCTDAHLPELCPRLMGKTTMEEVRAQLEPALLSVRFLQPLARATAVRAGVSLPEWAVGCLKDSVDDYIEDGAAEFEKEFKETPK